LSIVAIRVYRSSSGTKSTTRRCVSGVGNSYARRNGPGLLFHLIAVAEHDPVAVQAAGLELDPPFRLSKK